MFISRYVPSFKLELKHYHRVIPSLLFLCILTNVLFLSRWTKKRIFWTNSPVPECMTIFDYLFTAHMFRASQKQCLVAILVTNTYTLLCIENWLENLSMPPSENQPFLIQGKPVNRWIEEDERQRKRWNKKSSIETNLGYIASYI